MYIHPSKTPPSSTVYHALMPTLKADYFRYWYCTVTIAYVKLLRKVNGEKHLQSQVGHNLSLNKRLARECLDMIFNQHKPAQAVAQYIGANYRQHNPDAPDGPQGVVAYATGYLKANPELRLDFKCVIAEGDFVVVHSHLKPNSGDRGRAVVDIFRVENERLVEHWDVMQPEGTLRQNWLKTLFLRIHLHKRY